MSTRTRQVRALPEQDGGPHIVIIGGGMTGLAAAFVLEQAGVPPAGYTLLERETRLGGKIATEQTGGFTIEAGPDSFIAQKPWALQLARELGLGADLAVPEPARHSTYVLHRGRPRPLPEGMALIVPTRLLPFALSPVFSPLGKLRMALDLVIPPRRDEVDETLGAFIRRRLGREALDRLAEPLMAGIHSADAERQSLLATFPRFRHLERTHGSLMRGILAQRRARPKQTQHPSEPPAVASALATSPFVTLRGGVGQLVDTLAPRLGGRLLLGRKAAALMYDPLATPAYRVVLDDGESIAASAVILTTPAYDAAHLLAPLVPALADALHAIRYVSTTTVSLAYRRAEANLSLEGYGVVIPRAERRRINACTVTSRKFAHRAPDDGLLIRAFVGGSRTPEMLYLDDESLVAVVRDEVRAILGIAAEPLFSRVYRWTDSNPQYDVGHLDRVARIRQVSPPGLFLAGAAYDGVGLPDCIRQGQVAAAQALAHTKNPYASLSQSAVAASSSRW